MLKINLQNILEEAIGKTHGLSQKNFIASAKKHQSLVDLIFKSSKKNGYGFLSLPEDQKNLKAIQSFARQQKKEGWKHVVVLGIGGSALGTIAVREALLANDQSEPQLHILDNIDPAFTGTFLAGLPVKKTLFIVISKSGTTTEPMVLYALAKEMLLKTVPKNYQKHLVFITDPKEGLLRKIGKEEGIKMFDIPPNIGGRFSVLTNVGLLPCALAGVDIEDLLKGAKQMKAQLKNKKAIENPALNLALLQWMFDQKKQKPMTVLMPYSTLLFRMGDWYRQLLSESIGKNERSGPTPINALGTTDQHSQLQLYSDGPNNKLLIFMRVIKHQVNPKLSNHLPGEMSYLNGKTMSQVIDAAYQGTAEALKKKKRPNLTLEIEQVDAEHLGALFMLFEFQVALLGLLYKVNAFDQPGVEASKKITKKILADSD